MSKARVRELREMGDKLFRKKSPLDSMWQDIAENFYPERADFTTERAWGAHFAEHLMTGRPVLARRTLADSLSSMLRPRDKVWAHIRTQHEDINNDSTARTYLDHLSDKLNRIMYDKKAMLIRATKQGDNDYAAFGQCVIHPERRRERDGLIFRAKHLRDTAWCENSEMQIDTVHWDWKAEARELCKKFPKTVASAVEKIVEKEPYKEIKCRHIIVPSDQYDYKRSAYTDAPANKRRLPFMSIYIDVENDTIMEEIPVPSNDYVIPRWVTISGCQYAFSPATVVATPDARMIQKIALTLLEAGEKAVDPPMKAVGEMIQGGVQMYAGGITWVDPDYDETTGKALEPMPLDTRGLNFGVALMERIEAVISEAFFLNKINLPFMDHEKSIYEMKTIVDEYIRGALPLFEPIEIEYNGGLCEKSFEIAMLMGAFGNFDDMPDILAGRELRFQFESPLQAASERSKVAAFQQTGQILAQAMALDPSVRHMFDVRRATKDAVMGSGAPAEWNVPDEVANKAMAAEQQQIAAKQKAQELLSTVGAVSGAAQAAGDAAQSVNAALVPAEAA